MPCSLEIDGRLVLDKGQMQAEPQEIEPPDEIRINLEHRDSDPTKCWISINDRNNRVNNFNDLYATLLQLKASGPERPVIIHGLSKVHYQYIISAMDACKRAEIKDVKFQAPPVPDGGDDWWHK